MAPNDQDQKLPSFSPADTTKIVVHGDENEAKKLQQLIGIQLNKLESNINFSGNPQEKLSLDLGGGYGINVKSVYGTRTVDIYVPEKGGEKKELPELIREMLKQDTSWFPYYFCFDRSTLVGDISRMLIFYDRADKSTLNVLSKAGFSPVGRAYDYIFGTIGVKDYVAEYKYSSQTRRGSDHYHFDSFQGYIMTNGTYVWIHVGTSVEDQWVEIRTGWHYSMTFYLGDANNPYWQKQVQYESTSVNFGKMSVYYFDSMEGQDDPNGNPSGQEIWADIVSRGLTQRPDPQWPDTTGGSGWGDAGSGASYATTEGYMTRVDYNEYMERIIYPSWLSTRIPGPIPDSYGFHYVHFTIRVTSPGSVGTWTGNPFTQDYGSNVRTVEWWQCFKHPNHVVVDRQLSSATCTSGSDAGPWTGTFAYPMQANAFSFDRWWRGHQFKLFHNGDGVYEEHDLCSVSCYTGPIDSMQNTFLVDYTTMVMTVDTVLYAFGSDSVIANKSYTCNTEGLHFLDNGIKNVPGVWGCGYIDPIIAVKKKYIPEDLMDSYSNDKKAVEI